MGLKSALTLSLLLSVASALTPATSPSTTLKSTTTSKLTSTSKSTTVKSTTSSKSITSTTLQTSTLKPSTTPKPTTTLKPTTTATGNGITTPLPTQSGMTTSCNAFYLVQNGDSCQDVLSEYNLSISTFYSWNPAVGPQCNYLWVGYYACVGVIPSTTTKPTNGISTPAAVQTGITSNCDKFYQVKQYDTCDGITGTYNVPLSTFYSWNPAVGKQCTNLLTGDYVCVHTIGYAASPSATPVPFEAGMTKNCNKFHKVAAGETCKTIAKKQGVTVQQIETWNPEVGSDCSNLWESYYICIGVKK